jgi:FAD:protein FMN transferase
VSDGAGRKAYLEQIMGMPVSVHLRGPAPESEPARAAVARVFDRLRHADRVFSLYRDDSDLSRLTRGELAQSDADPDLAEVTALCEQAEQRTDGWFDPRLPGPDGLRRWDPTGLVKGWAVQRAAEALADLPDHDFCLNAGGDILAGSRRHGPAGAPWRIGIEDPADRNRLLDVAEVRSGAAATSGTAARGEHILDPFTGRPSTALLSVTVTGPSLLWADVYATAAFARGAGAVDWLRGLADHSALVVDAAGEITRVRWVRSAGHDRQGGRGGGG